MTTARSAARETSLHICAACDEPLHNGNGWHGVPGFGDLCNSCHGNIFEGTKEPKYKSLAQYVRFLEGHCEGHLGQPKIGVAVRCRGCGGWIE